jgi:hypothetical protein
MHTLANITVSPVAPLVRNKPGLDSVYEQLQAGRITGALDELFADLRGRREERIRGLACVCKYVQEPPCL